MQRRDLIIGATVLIVIAIIVFFIQRRRQEVITTPTPLPTTSVEQTEQNIEDKFKVDIPQNVDKADLKDIKGTGFSGIATREFKNGVFDMTILADLPDPDSGRFYQVWVRKNNETKLLGTMRVAKGGFLLDISSREDLTSFNEVVVSEESKSDNQIENTVLQGSF